MTAEFEIGRAEPDDIAEMMEIERAAAGAAHWAEAEYAAIFATDNPAVERVAFVARLRGSEGGFRVAGFVVGKLLRLSDSAEAELENVAVRNGLRGQGIGGALVNRLVEWCGSVGAEVLRLEVRASNQAAVKVYERAGFLLEGRRRKYYCDPGEDAILLERRI